MSKWDKTELLNATIYVDYENISGLLDSYGVDPLMVFPVIFDKFKSQYELNVIECVAYGNFEKKPLHGKQLTALKDLGVTTRHLPCQGQNCGRLMLTADIAEPSDKNSHIDVFVLSSNDSEMIPVLKAFKYENKFTYMLSSKFDRNPAVPRYADCHEYIEDILNLNSASTI